MLYLSLSEFFEVVLSGATRAPRLSSFASFSRRRGEEFRYEENSLSGLRFYLGGCRFVTWGPFLVLYEGYHSWNMSESTRHESDSSLGHHADCWVIGRLKRRRDRADMEPSAL